MRLGEYLSNLMGQPLFQFAKSVIARQPATSVLFVTNRCNLDCKMCFYTAREQRHELTVEEVRRLAQSMPPQWYVMFTGGEPFIRSDLPEIVAAFYERGAANLHISTNCTYHDRTVSGIRRIAAHARDARVIVVTSIDGPPDLHDRIREKPGVFQRTVDTVRTLLALKHALPNLTVIATFTFSALNQNHWRETIEYLRQDLKVDAVNIGLVRGKTKDNATKAYDIEKYRQAVDYLLRTNRREYFPFPLGAFARFKEAEQAETIYRIAKQDPPPHYRCLAGRVFHVITETGDLYPCEMLDHRIGSLRDVNMDFMELVRSAQAKEIARFIDRRECLCTYECAIGPSLAANPSMPGRFVKFLIQKRGAEDACGT
jgi:MoaA/NifB/PqqE/SkfB family radical SAM enzyme